MWRISFFIYFSDYQKSNILSFEVCTYSAARCMSIQTHGTSQGLTRFQTAGSYYIYFFPRLELLLFVLAIGHWQVSHRITISGWLRYSARVSKRRY